MHRWQHLCSRNVFWSFLCFSIYLYLNDFLTMRFHFEIEMNRMCNWLVSYFNFKELFCREKWVHKRQNWPHIIWIRECLNLKKSIIKSFYWKNTLIFSGFLFHWIQQQAILTLLEEMVMTDEQYQNYNLNELYSISFLISLS